jgi:hypothetical protein
MMKERFLVLLCAFLGHPRVVDVCFGQVTCARCHAILGDTLMGVYDLRGRVIVDHDCEVCRTSWTALKWHERIAVHR